jgi:hypothetical protein
MTRYTDYFDQIYSGTKPIIGCILAATNYVLFPDHAFKTAFFAVGAAMLLDIATKYLALSKKGGGFRQATKTRVIDSNALWRGTSIKLVSYLIVFILAGFSYRVTMLTQASIFLATVIYSVIFLREAQSILENLCDAGADLNWLLVWTRKKEKQILKDDDFEDPGGGGPTI